jgi:hypothetical protein
VIAIGHDLQAAWEWQPHNLPPLLLTPNSIAAALTHEMFRVGHRVRLYGGQDNDETVITFPGAKSPRIELVGRPDLVKPLVDVLKQATGLASDILRGGRSTSAPAPEHVETSPHHDGGGGGAKIDAAAKEPVAANGHAVEAVPSLTASEQKLASLLKRQAELAADPATDEAVYQGVVSEIAAAAAAVDAERGAQS